MRWERKRELETAMNHSPTHYLILDLEATCCDRGSVPRDEREILEIGAVMMDARSFEVCSEFQTFIHPVRHPCLTAFCVGLTHISQAEVEAAPLFPAALAALEDWMRPFVEPLFCSWGRYDRDQLRQDCAFHGARYPFGDRHLDLKAELSKALPGARGRKRYGLRQALEMLGMAFEGEPHRGLVDARNVGRVVSGVLGRI